MLLLAHEAYSGQFEVATVNHGLRDTAAAECAFVEQVCHDRGIACATLNVSVGEGNVQAQARAARYGALERWVNERGLAALLTAHHADDQAETLMMRLNRGSGIAGLAGVRADHHTKHNSLRILRPLLNFRRAELASVVEACGLVAVADPSNRDTRYDRVRIREALADAAWLDPLSISRSAQNLADADEALSYAADRFWEEHAEQDGQTIRLRLHPMRETRMRLITRAIERLGGTPRGGDVAQLEQNLARIRKANIAGVMIELKLEEEGPFFHFAPEPPRNS
ncbi:tRNA(Ile)-lysidine synthetase [Altererythrobacter insulae]|nr:tRNA(Ile)-lysidine synthetase [Altererythrobacter insulae]